MEINLTEQKVFTNEIVLDETLEQGVELDYLLPDYNPEIFKVLCCSLDPRICSKEIIDSKLVIDGFVFIKVAYLAQESNQVYVIDQKIPFSKSVSLRKETRSPEIYTTLSTQYANCRAVNSRRIDIRGAISITCKVIGLTETVVIGAAEGENVLYQTQVLSGLEQKIYETKQFTVKEQLDLADGNPSIKEVLRCDVMPGVSETKIIQSKVIFKGESHIRLVYRTVSGEIESMEYHTPISQIIDVAGLDDSFECQVCVSVCSIETETDGELEQEVRTVYLSTVMTACCHCAKNHEFSLMTDAYSTKYDAEIINQNITSSSLADMSIKNFSAKIQAEFEEQVVAVEAVWYKIENIESYARQVKFRLNTTFLCKLDDGQIVCISKNFEISEDVDLNGDLFPCVNVADFAYNMNAEGAELRVEFNMTVSAYINTNVYVVESITVNDQSEKPRADCGMILYFAESGEEVWSIAKRYNTNAELILEENNLIENVISEKRLLLIRMI